MSVESDLSVESDMSDESMSSSDPEYPQTWAEMLDHIREHQIGELQWAHLMGMVEQAGRMTDEDYAAFKKMLVPPTVLALAAESGHFGDHRGEEVPLNWGPGNNDYQFAGAYAAGLVQDEVDEAAALEEPVWPEVNPNDYLMDDDSLGFEPLD